MTKILITGGSGAIGSRLAETLSLNKENKICVVDNLSSGNNNKVNNVEYVYLDISNEEKLNIFFESYQPEYIYHLAAHFANQNSVDYPLSDTKTNVLGTINLLENQRKNTNLKKFIYASSSCVYGNIENMVEDATLFPYDTPYAINKYVGEMYCKYYSEIQKVPTVCVRIFNTYGPGEMPGKYRNVIPNFILKALNNEPITITGSGNETRDFTFIDDTVQLLMLVAVSHFNKAEVFNGGTGQSIAIKQMAESITQLTNSASTIEYLPSRNWDHVKERKSNNTKAKNLLNYNPSTLFEDGLKKTIDWIKTKVN